MSGKGDKRRPAKVSDEEFASNWERVFGKKPERDLQDAYDVLDEQERDDDDAS